MRARLAFLAALVVLMSTFAAPAGTSAGPYATSSAHSAFERMTGSVAVHSMPNGLTHRSPDVRRGVPYEFDCSISEALNGVESTYRKYVAGELTDHPVYFEVDAARIDEPNRSLRRSYRCTISIGRGQDDDVLGAGVTQTPVVARLGGGGHFHTITWGESQPLLGLGGTRIGRRTIVANRQVRWIMTSQEGSARTTQYIHEAECEGFVLRAATDPRPLNGWCAHEEPREGRATRRDPPSREQRHDDGAWPISDIPEPVRRIVEQPPVRNLTDALLPADEPDLPVTSPPLPRIGLTMPPVPAVDSNSGIDWSRRGDLNS